MPVPGKVNIELGPGDAGLVSPADVETVGVEFKLLQLTLQTLGIHAKIKQRADEHVTGNPTEQVEIEGLHFLHHIRTQRTQRQKLLCVL